MSTVLTVYHCSDYHLFSVSLQLMKIAFDEEVSPDDVEAFRKLSTKYRSPTTVFMTFAFVGQVVPQPSAMLKPVEKNASLKYTYTHKISCHNVHCICTITMLHF